MNYLSSLGFPLARLGACCLVVMLSGIAHAAEPVFDVQRFIESAAIKSIAEIETARVALQKSPSAEVRAYAEAMIAEQREHLNSLRELAEKAHIAMAGEDQLRQKAWSVVLERRGMSFDAAYADMRATERKKTVDLYRAAIQAKDPVVSPYAQVELPGFMRQLHQAQQLVRAFGSQTDADVQLQEESRLAMKMN